MAKVVKSEAELKAELLAVGNGYLDPTEKLAAMLARAIRLGLKSAPVAAKQQKLAVGQPSAAQFYDAMVAAYGDIPFSGARQFGILGKAIQRTDGLLTELDATVAAASGYVNFLRSKNIPLTMKHLIASYEKFLLEGRAAPQAGFKPPPLKIQ